MLDSVDAQHALSIGHMKDVFQLVHALWSTESSAADVFYSFLSPSEASLEYPENIARRMGLNHWLKSVTKDKVELEVGFAGSSLDALFSRLTGKQVYEAAKLALEEKDYKLATLVSQSTSYTSFSQDILAQLSIWQESGALSLISDKRLKIYKLLSGDVNTTVKYCTSCDLLYYRGLDWKRCFSLHFWYGTQSNATIDSILTQYEKSSKANYCTPPLAPYLEGATPDLPRIPFDENETVLCTSGK